MLKAVKFLLILIGFVLFFICAIMVFDPSSSPVGYFISLIK